jgi:hypothetical protein
VPKLGDAPSGLIRAELIGKVEADVGRG